jgi:GH25 family lysozyme M1 (1,4-beta-N-acetylmuramidase)
MLIDISKWQGEFDWQTAKDMGVIGAIIRAGSINKDTGECYEDYQFRRNAEMGPYYMPVAAYFFARTKFDGEMQGEFFLNLVRDYPLFSAIPDIEAAGAPCATLRANGEKLGVTITRACYGTRNILYTRASHWNAIYGNPAWARAFDLWVARYNDSLYHPWGDGYYKPAAWNDWVLWQYTDQGDGEFYGAESKEIDLDRFNGDFLDYIGGTELPVIQIPKHYSRFIIERV